MADLNVFEQAIASGAIDIGEYGEPYTDTRYLAAWLMLPENDNGDYRAFRKLLINGNSTNNKDGRDNIRRAVVWASRVAPRCDILERMNGITTPHFRSNCERGSVEAVFDACRFHATLIYQLRQIPPYRKTQEDIDYEQWVSRFKRENIESFDFDDDLGEDDDDEWGSAGAPWGYVA